MKITDAFVAGALAMIFTLLLFRLWGGMLAAQENALHRVQAVNDATLLVNSFRETSRAAAGPPVDPSMLRGISEFTLDEGLGPDGFSYRQLGFVLLGKHCSTRTGDGK